MESATSAWANGPAKRAHFPIFKAQLRIKPPWRWRAAVLKSTDHEFRLLAQVRSDKPNYKAWLVVRVNGAWAMVARLESDNHSGLHCHAECGDGALTIGEIATSDMMRFPHSKAKHRRPHKMYSEAAWWEKALKFFRAQTAERGALL